MIPEPEGRTPGEPLPSGGSGFSRQPRTRIPRHGSLGEGEKEKEKTALPPTPISFSSSFISLLPKLFTVALPLATAWGGFLALLFGRSGLRGCLGILPNSTSPACAQKAVENCGGLDCSSLGANSLHPHPGRLHAD